MICGPGDDGKKGEVISKGGKGKGGKGKGKKGKGGKGGKGEDGRPQSRHMVPTPLGLSFLAAFEEMDFELCRPPIRAFMEKQVAQIADGILEKDEVTQQNLQKFYDKFIQFRESISSLERFFVKKDSWGDGKGGGGWNDGKGGGGSGFAGRGEKRQHDSWGGGGDPKRRRLEDGGFAAEGDVNAVPLGGAKGARVAPKLWGGAKGSRGESKGGASIGGANVGAKLWRGASGKGGHGGHDK